MGSATEGKEERRGGRSLQGFDELDLTAEELESRIVDMITTKISEWQSELQAAIAQASLPMRQRDPEALRRACERMDQMREELRQRIGTVDWAVDLIRDARNP